MPFFALLSLAALVDQAMPAHWVADEQAFYFNNVYLKSICYTITSTTIVSCI
jgi:hypothetical protein